MSELTLRQKIVRGIAKLFRENVVFTTKNHWLEEFLHSTWPTIEAHIEIAKRSPLSDDDIKEYVKWLILNDAKWESVGIFNEMDAFKLNFIKQLATGESHSKCGVRDEVVSYISAAEKLAPILDDVERGSITPESFTRVVAASILSHKHQSFAQLYNYPPKLVANAFGLVFNKNVAEKLSSLIIEGKLASFGPHLNDKILIATQNGFFVQQTIIEDSDWAKDTDIKEARDGELSELWGKICDLKVLMLKVIRDGKHEESRKRIVALFDKIEPFLDVREAWNYRNLLNMGVVIGEKTKEPEVPKATHNHESAIMNFVKEVAHEVEEADKELCGSKEGDEHLQTEAKDITKELAENELLETFRKLLEEDEQESNKNAFKKRR